MEKMAGNYYPGHYIDIHFLWLTVAIWYFKVLMQLTTNKHVSVAELCV